MIDDKLVTSIAGELFEEEAPDELKTIFKHRLIHGLQEFCSIEKIWRNVLKLDQFADPAEMFLDVGRSIHDRYMNELSAYKKKHRQEIRSTLKKAKSGDDESLFRLVAWDKCWVCMDFVCSRIVRAQEKGDKDFINKLAGHLKTKSPDVIKIKARQNETVLALMKVFTFAAVVRGKKITHDELKGIHNILDRRMLLDNEDDYSRFSDFTYFKKYLERHGVPIERFR